MSEAPITVKEGWILKRGEYIKNWRPRYFRLNSNGEFRGYKDAPKGKVEPDALNDFRIEKSMILKSEKPKPNTFIVRCFQWTTLVERTFAADSCEERESWIQAIQGVNATLENQQTNAGNGVKDDSDSFTMDDFDVLKVLGKGTLGKVVLGREKKTGEVFAIKVFKKEAFLQEDEVELENSLTKNRMVQKISHPFLASLEYFFQTSDRLYFVMEYVDGGELFFHLSRDRVFTEERARFYCAEIVSALSYLHGQDVIYRDMKVYKQIRVKVL